MLRWPESGRPRADPCSRFTEPVQSFPSSGVAAPGRKGIGLVLRPLVGFSRPRAAGHTHFRIRPECGTGQRMDLGPPALFGGRHLGCSRSHTLSRGCAGGGPKDNPHASVGRRADPSASAAPLPQRWLREALQASSGYRSATGGVRAHQVGVNPSARAVAFDGCCVSVRAQPLGWEHPVGPALARESDRSIGEALAPARVRLSPPLRSRSRSSTGVFVARICCRSR